jgi:hypothetical protein
MKVIARDDRRVMIEKPDAPTQPTSPAAGK